MNFNSVTKDDSEKSIGLLFIRTYNLWHDAIKQALGTIPITHPQFVMMTALGYLEQTEKEVTQVMISQLSGTDVMTVSQIARTLEKKGILLREKHSKDTRAKSLSLTQEGRTIMNQAIPIVEKVDADFFGVLEGKEKGFSMSLKELVEKNQIQQ